MKKNEAQVIILCDEVIGVASVRHQLVLPAGFSHPP
jgi:hypothetical protein